MSKIRPKFNKELPENWKYFFTKTSDVQFKAQHPIGYVLLVIVAMIVIIAPGAIFIFFADIFAPNVNSPLLILGLVGGFSISVGLFNILAAFIHQHLGHKVTYISIIIGLLLCVLSIVIMSGIS